MDVEARPLTILDPTAERDPQGRPLAAALPATAPLRVALLDIRKPRGNVFLDELERLLVARGHAVERTAKPTFTRPAPIDLRREIAERFDAVVEALAD
jgi:hypothetical protein